LASILFTSTAGLAQDQENESGTPDSLSELGDDASTAKTGLEGQWLVEYSDADNQSDNKTHGVYSLWPNEDTATTGIWNYTACDVPGTYHCTDGQITVSPEGVLQHQHAYGFKGLWGAYTTVKQVGPDELSGQWTYQDRYGGAEVWRRVHPEVTRVTLSSQVADDFDPSQRPGRVELTYDGYWWGPTSDMRANRPKFTVSIEGKNLWGRHNIRIEPRLDSANLLTSDLELLCCGRIHNPTAEITGLGMEVLAWAGAVPGRKTLYVDDVAIPFDFIVHGHPRENEIVWPDDATTPEDLVTFELSLVGEGPTGTINLEKLDEDTPFRISLNYTDVPDTAPTLATLHWPEGSEDVALLPTDDPKVFASKTYYLAPVSFRDFRDVPGVRGAAGHSPKIAADLFAGQWDVNHTSGENGDARGIALMSEDGKNVRLLLVNGSERIRYESFEIMATRDSTGGRHTLDVRFERKKDGEPWGPLKARRPGSIEPMTALGSSPIQPSTGSDRLIPDLPDAPLGDAREVTESPVQPRAENADRLIPDLPDAPLGDAREVTESPIQPGAENAGRLIPDLPDAPAVENHELALPGEAPALDNRVIYVADGTKTITVEAVRKSKEVAVELPDGPPERFRVSLMMRQSGKRMSGAWSRELPDGNLGAGGQQTWGSAARIERVVVLEDQRPAVKDLGSYADFMKDPNPRSADYIRAPPPSNADTTTEYPFREGAQNDSTRRRLFIYGHNLPRRASDAFVLKAGDSAFKYDLIALPGEGHDDLFARGWRKAGIDNTEDYSALVVEAEFEDGTKPGVTALLLNGAPGYWRLDFADANAFMEFSHGWHQDIDTGTGEFSTAETAYTDDLIYVTLTEQAPLDLDELGITLFKNGEEVASLFAMRYDPPGETEKHRQWCEQQRAQRGGAVGDGGDFDLWCKRCRGLPDYRSDPIRLRPVGPMRPEAGGQTEILSPLANPPTELEVLRGDILEARIADSYRYRMQAIPPVARTTLISHPGELGPTWRAALKRAAACYQDGSKDIDFDAMTREQAETYSKFIFTENFWRFFMPLGFGTLSFRDIDIHKGDHAAAILIRDEFLEVIEPRLRDLRQIATDDAKLWQFYQTRVSSTMPFWRVMKVKGPDEGWESETTAFLLELGYEIGDQAMSPLAKAMIEGAADYLPAGRDDGEWPIGDLVDTVLTNPAGSGISTRHAHLYALRKTRQALLTLLDRASNAHARALQAGDCNIEELMLIGGQDADEIVARILPRLVLSSGDAAGAYWQPDRVARAYVGSLKEKGAAIRALEAYGRIDEAYQALALAAVTAGTAATLTAGGLVTAGAALMLAADAADLIYFGSKTLDQYLESGPLVEYAQGATVGGLEDDFYLEAEAMRTEGWEAAVALLAPAVGVVSGAGSLRTIRSIERGADVLKGIKVLDADDIGRLSRADQDALLSYFSDLHARRPGNKLRDLNNLGRVLDDAELKDFRKFADFYRKGGLEVTGEGLRQIGTPAKIANELEDAKRITGSGIDASGTGAESARRAGDQTEAPGIARDPERLSPEEAAREDIAGGRRTGDGDATADTVRETVNPRDQPLIGLEERLGPDFENALNESRINTVDESVDTPRRGAGDTERLTPEETARAESTGAEAAERERLFRGAETERIVPDESSGRSTLPPDDLSTVPVGSRVLPPEGEPLPVRSANATPDDAAVARENFMTAHEKVQGELKDIADHSALYRGDKGRVLRIGQTGDPVADELRLGEYIGHGSFNDVFRAAEDGRVARISRYTGDHKSILLDAEGRLGSERAMRNHPDAVMIPTQYRIYRNIDSPDPRLKGKTIEIVDYADFDKASNVIKRNADQQPTPEQAYTYWRGVDALNTEGYVLADGHGGNYTFGTNAAGNPVLVILDPGAVVKAAGNTLAERQANARAAQNLFDRPPPEMSAHWERLPDKYRYPVKKEVLTTGLPTGSAQGPLEGLLDLDAYGLRYPEQVPMLPVGAEPYPRMNELSGLSPAEAKRQFELMQEDYLKNPPTAPATDDGALLLLPGEWRREKVPRFGQIENESAFRIAA
jgi:hypothetical protein